MDPTSSRWAPSAARLHLDVVLLGSIVVVLAIAVLVGWAGGDARLTAVGEDFEPMKPITALTLLPLGAAVALAGGSPSARWRLAGLVAGGLGVAVGSIQLAAALASWDDPLSSIVFAPELEAVGRGRAGQMAPLTAIGVVLASASILALSRRRTRIAHVVAVVLTVLAATVVTGYGYGVTALRSFGADAGVALLSAVGLALLGVAVVRATPEHGLAAVAAQGPGAAFLLQWALPLVLGTPLLAGWLQLRAQEADVVDPALGEAILAATASAVGGVVVWRSGVSVARYEQSRGRARAALEAANAGLEAEVASRTEALRTVEAVQRESLDALEEGVAVVADDLQLLLLNRAGRRLLGYEPAELGDLWRSGRWVTFREDGTPLPRAERPIERSLATGEPASSVVLRWRAKDGTMVLLSVSTRPLLDGGRVRGLVLAFADVTAGRPAPATTGDQRAVDTGPAARGRYRVLVVAAGPSGSPDLRRDLTFAGYEVAVAGDRAGLAKLARQQRPDLVLVEAGGELDGTDLVTDLRTDRLTAHLPVLLLVTEASGAEAARAIAAGAIDVIRTPVETVELLARIDVAVRTTSRTSDLVHLSRSLDRASRTDPLTGLLNRRGLDDQIDRLEGVLRPQGETASALAIDLDRFKSVNDRFGHLAGDRALQAVAAAIAEGLRADDAAGRWGGEEFVVVLPGTDLAGATAVAERMRAAVEQLALAGDGGEAFGVTVSIGVAEAADGRVADAVAAADANLLAAKADGRNRVDAGTGPGC